jgi:hypothetical protein
MTRKMFYEINMVCFLLRMIYLLKKKMKLTCCGACFSAHSGMYKDG